MVSEDEFVRLWAQLSPEAEDAVIVALSCSPDAADGSSPVDVLTIVERSVDQPDLGGLMYGLTAADVRELVGRDVRETIPVGSLLTTASAESTGLGGFMIEPLHLLLSVLAFDSLLVTRELGWGGITYERMSRWARRRFRLGRR